MNYPRIAIIILNWNGARDTLECLASLQRITYPDPYICLVDNGSRDDSVTQIRACHPDLDILETGENLGFAVGNNLGLQKALANGCDYSLLLNNDTLVSPDFLEKMVVFMETHPGVGMAGPAIYYQAEPDTIWSAGGVISRWSGDTRMLHLGEKDLGQLGDEPYATDFITGCALMVRNSLVAQIGGMDDRFFLYFEETEWCVRARKTGWQIFVVPSSRIWHKISSQIREASPIVQYYMARNRLLFLKLTGAGPLPYLVTLASFARTGITYYLRPRWKARRDRQYITNRGVLDFFRGRFGKANFEVLNQD